jgi:hypothetical protein
MVYMPDWHCPTCKRFSILGGADVAQSNFDKQQQRIAEHTKLHTAQLAEHDGDHEALKLRIQTPALHAALAAMPVPEPDTEEVPDDGLTLE